MYTLIRPLLFCLPPEASHDITLNILNLAHKLKLTKLLPKPILSPTTIMGLNFPNPVGLAAGLDKSGDYIDALSTLGFGFLEIGTITPRAQTGNPKPRLFRLPQQKAFINRMGFNNKGCDYLVERLKHISYRGILGINIGKNASTPLENAADDYLTCWDKLAPYASYLTINISSPNTTGLRDLQRDDLLQPLLAKLKARQTGLSRYVPLVVKIAPDLTHAELKNLAAILLQEKIDGVIATNTSLQRAGVESAEAGGLSGKPITALATQTVAQLHELLGEQIPLIASGGVMSVEDARDKINAGATLVQVYSGVIYRGVKLIKEIGGKV